MPLKHVIKNNRYSQICNDTADFIINFNKCGKIKNIESDGITNQKTLVDSWDIFSTLFVSVYIHMNAITVMNGTDAKTPPQKVLRFDISEIAVISNAENKILII